MPLPVLPHVPLVNESLPADVALNALIAPVALLVDQHIRPQSKSAIAEPAHERLQRIVRQQVTLVARRVGKLLRAVLALVGFLSGVDPRVDLQVVRGFEAAPTYRALVLRFALLGFGFVQLEMRLQIAFAEERLLANGTLEPPVFGVYLFVVR
ncbi:AAEL010495-PA [Aedes aegypti]|uniref:AAEL010495-PA n=1 Tax=Aedes aegypti TaxID=7159 RepID=Q16ST0_AEDAE|nr:AAEL010495-PA [Aedes aegypti]